MRVVGVIPARLASRRLPRKVLLPLAGKPILQHVYERSLRARLDALVVATDSREVESAARAFGAEVVRTSPTHKSGTDRVAEVAKAVPADVYLNIQGDEPFMTAVVLNRLVSLMGKPQVEVGTVVTRLPDQEAEDPQRVKVIVTREGRCLYFSRAAIPYVRHHQPFGGYRLHVGLYAYRRDALLSFARLEPGLFEEVEGLEQLRFLENGVPIYAALVRYQGFGIDTKKDLEQAERLLRRRPA